MATKNLNLGIVPVSRGEFNSTTIYYKDNIVQYKRGSYQVVSESPITGISPTNDKNVVNPGWTLFAGTLDAQDVVNQIKEQETKSIQAVAAREAEILTKSDAAKVSFDNTGTSLNGTNMQNALEETDGKINQLKNAGYLYAGIATPTTNPGTPEGPVFYIANGKGTYTNFGGIEVTENEMVILYYDTVWHKNATGIASNDKLTELESNISNLSKEVNDNSLQINGGYAEIHPVLINGYVINYNAVKVESPVYSITEPISIIKGQTLILVAYGEYAALAFSLYNSKNDTYTEISRYNGASPAKQTYTYTALEDCKVVACFRTEEEHNLQISINGLISTLEQKIDDVPNDGKIYNRKYGAWKEASDIAELKSYNIIPNQWENGYISITGELDETTDAFRSAEFIKIDGGAKVMMMTRPAEAIPLSLVYINEYSANDGTGFIKRGIGEFDKAYTFSENARYFKISLTLGEITSENFLDYAQYIGAAYSAFPVNFVEYKPQPYLLPSVQIEGVHKKKRKLKWCAMGDSITDGSYSVIGDTNNYHWDREDCYVSEVAKICQYDVQNVGIGGTGWLKKGAQGDEKNAKEQVQLLNFADYDLVTLAFGVNDWKSNDAFEYGSVEDDKNANTIAASMKYCIEKIMNDNPLCKIVVLTPLNCRPLNGTFENNYAIGTPSHGKTLQDMFDLIVSVCKYYGIQYIDLTHTSIINRCNIVTMTPDGVHPSKEAHHRLGWQIAHSIQYNL